MTLEELMAEFPHGSRWRYTEGLNYYDRLSTLDGSLIGPFEVVGWDRAFVLLRDEDGHRMWEPEQLRHRIERIPDPVPCPITEPTTFVHDTIDLYEYGPQQPRWIEDDYEGVRKITLHPAEPGATEGRYTWKQP